MKQEKIDNYLERVSEATGESVEDIQSKCKEAQFVSIRRAIAYSLSDHLVQRQIKRIINKSLGGTFKMIKTGEDLHSVEDSRFMYVYDKVKDIKF